MNTKLLKYAVELATLNSSQKVADKFDVNRSSISRNIKRLEDELGAQLFMKLDNKLIPTYVGDIVLRYAREILRMEENMMFDISAEGVYHGTVNIGMGTSRTLSVLTEVLPEFRSKYPNITVHLHEMCTTELMEELVTRSLDFAVVSKTMNAEGIVFEPMILEELVLVAPRGDTFAKEHSYEKNGRVCADLKCFGDKPFALGHIGQKSRSVANSVFQQLGIKPNIIFQTANNYTLAMMANNGLAYTLVPVSSTRMRDSEIPFYYLDPDMKVEWYVGIAYPSQGEMSRAAMQLKIVMKEILTDRNK